MKSLFPYRWDTLVCVGVTINILLNAKFNKNKLLQNWKTNRELFNFQIGLMHTWQGSMDGQHWMQLRTHHNDQTLCQAGQYASWPIFGSQALLPFRFFRVILLGPTTSLSAQWNLSLCYLELYGYFRWLVPTSTVCSQQNKCSYSLCLLSILC